MRRTDSILVLAGLLVGVAVGRLSAGVATPPPPVEPAEPPQPISVCVEVPRILWVWPPIWNQTHWHITEDRGISRFIGPFTLNADPIRADEICADHWFYTVGSNETHPLDTPRQP
jgi:hypothetical protein